jgi:hypothetical protein
MVAVHAFVSDEGNAGAERTDEAANHERPKVCCVSRLVIDNGVAMNVATWTAHQNRI